MMWPDEYESQKAQCIGASVLQDAWHLRNLPSTLDGARYDALRKMQPGPRKVPKIAPAAKLRTRRESGRLCAVLQATRDSYQQALPEVPGSPCRPGSGSESDTSVTLMRSSTLFIPSVVSILQ